MVLNYNNISVNSLQFKNIKRLLIASFPSDERRDMADYERIARDNAKFSLLAAMNCNNFAGFISSWDFDRFSYVEHFAIESTLRGQGLGGQLLSHFVATVGKPVILEVEPPESEMARRRIAFYRRHGFKLWSEIDYVQPPYSPSQHAQPMRLMTCGFTAAAQVSAAAREMKRVVYGVAADD